MATLPDLTDEQWEEITQRLTLYAAGKIAARWWRGLRANRDSSPLGVEANDLAAEAVVSVIDGRRNWNRTRYPDFLDYLQGVIDSKIQGMVECSENKTRYLEPVDTDDETPRPAPVDRAPPPEQLVANKEWMEKFRTALEKELGDDSLSKGLFECLDAGYTDRGEIADLLSVSVTDIYNAQKRLKTHVRKVMNKFNQGKK